MEYDNPLVSIFVITYNSAATVIEALDSVYNQTYPNLELVISDDCSKDDTVRLCSDWINEHGERFVRTRLITVQRNTGVTSNIIRAETACRGEWLKGVAGDDMLLPDSIATYVEYVSKHPDAIYVFSKVEVFGADKYKYRIERFEDVVFDYSFFNLPAQQQYEWLIWKSYQPIPAATTFYNRRKSEELGIRLDERIPMLDDWPRWIQCLEKGVHFYFINRKLVRYRVSPASICAGAKYYNQFFRSLALLYVYYQYRPAIKYKGWLKAWFRYVNMRLIIVNTHWHTVYTFMLTHIARPLGKYLKKCQRV